MDPSPEQPEAPPEALKERPTTLPGITVEELEQGYQDLRTMLHATLVALVVLTLGVTLVLGKQMRTIRYEVVDKRRLVQRVDQEFKIKEARMKAFISMLQAYTLTNQDFQPILNRYRLVVPQYFTDPVALTAQPLISPTTTNAPRGKAR